MCRTARNSGVEVKTRHIAWLMAEAMGMDLAGLVSCRPEWIKSILGETAAVRPTTVEAQITHGDVHANAKESPPFGRQCRRPIRR